MAKDTDAKAQPIYVAAERFVNQALRRDGSLFTPGQAIWILENARDLHKWFVEAPDLSKASVVVKFESQLAGALADTIQLAAELIYTHFLMTGTSEGVLIYPRTELPFDTHQIRVRGSRVSARQIAVDLGVGPTEWRDEVEHLIGAVLEATPAELVAA